MVQREYKRVESMSQTPVDLSVANRENVNARRHGNSLRSRFTSAFLSLATKRYLLFISLFISRATPVIELISLISHEFANVGLFLFLSSFSQFCIRTLSVHANFVAFSLVYAIIVRYSEFVVLKSN